MSMAAAPLLPSFARDAFARDVARSGDQFQLNGTPSAIPPAKKQSQAPKSFSTQNGNIARILSGARNALKPQVPDRDRDESKRPLLSVDSQSRASLEPDYMPDSAMDPSHKDIDVRIKREPRLSSPIDAIERLKVELINSSPQGPLQPQIMRDIGYIRLGMHSYSEYKEEVRSGTKNFTKEERAVLAWMQCTLENSIIPEPGKKLLPQDKKIIKVVVTLTLIPQMPVLTSKIKALSAEWLDALVKSQER
jgi:hypothetical protein